MIKKKQWETRNQTTVPSTDDEDILLYTKITSLHIDTSFKQEGSLNK